MISLLVQDMDRAKAFYTDALGFRVDKDFEQDGNRWVTVTPPGGAPSITLGTWYDELKPGGMKMYLSTPDVEATNADLTAKGIKPNTEIRDDPWGKWFGLDDPDGNNWSIVESKW